ncbi:MAG: enoyl-CoA hydratase-related protein [Pseudomonadota bacterium]
MSGSAGGNSDARGGATAPALCAGEVAPGVVRLALNRPSSRNALDESLIAALHEAVRRHAAEPATRVLLIAAEGPAFCAGADLRNMLERGRAGGEANLADARALAEMLLAIRECPKPSVALVQGAAFGGGVGLATACDVAIGSDAARFRLPEVQLGIVPAVISPYVVEAIGPREARRWILSGEPIDAERARALGLLHEVVPAMELATRGVELARAIAAGAPGALAACKALLAGLAREPASAGTAHATAALLAELRAGTEGQEGFLAALEKRAPAWRE